MSFDKKVNLEIEKGIGYITMNKPPANAYELDFWEQMDNVVDEASDSEDIRVIVIQSSSKKFFCAGADIKVFSSNSSAENLKMADSARFTTNKLADSPKISIAAINGHALGGGLELALACDLRFAAEGSYLLGLPEVSLGLMPGNGGTQRLTKLLGLNKALLLLLTGERCIPSKALDLGLVDKIFTQDSFNAETYSYAEKLAEGPFKAVSSIKKAAREGLTMGINESLELEKIPGFKTF